MDITVNSAVLSSVLNEEKLKDEIAEFLNGVIDAELEKENVNAELIDDCVDILLDIENCKSYQLNSNVLRFCHRKAFNNIRKKRIVAAIVVLLVAIGITLKANPVIADNTVSFFQKLVFHLKSESDDSEKGENVKSIYVSLPEDFSPMISGKEEIDTSEMKVYACYENLSEKELPISDCKVTTETVYDGEAQKIVLIVSYDGCVASIIYTVEGN